MYICNIIMWNTCVWIHHKPLGMNFSSLLLSHICRVEKSKWSQTWKIGFVDGLLSIASSHVWFVFCGVCTQCMTLMKEGTSVCLFVMNEYNMVPNVSFALLSGTYFSYEDSIVTTTHSSTTIILFPELSKHFSCWVGLGLSRFTDWIVSCQLAIFRKDVQGEQKRIQSKMHLRLSHL